MKTDNNEMNLELLLSTLEHAGRDARRREQLGAMVDGLAEAENRRRHGAWWWASRVAAAACVLFFLGTAVRVWFIPVEPQRQPVARVDIPIEASEAAPQAAPTDERAGEKAAVRRRPLSAAVKVAAEETPEMELLVAEELWADDDDTLELPGYIVEVAEPEAVPAMPPAQDDVPVAQAEPCTVQTPKEQKSSRLLQFLGSFIRRSEPDDMEGTVLAFKTW